MTKSENLGMILGLVYIGYLLNKETAESHRWAIGVGLAMIIWFLGAIYGQVKGTNDLLDKWWAGKHGRD